MRRLQIGAGFRSYKLGKRDCESGQLQGFQTEAKRLKIEAKRFQIGAEITNGGRDCKSVQNRTLLTRKNKCNLREKQFLRYFSELNMTLSCFNYLAQSIILLWMSDASVVFVLFYFVFFYFYIYMFISIYVYFYIFLYFLYFTLSSRIHIKHSDFDAYKFQATFTMLVCSMLIHIIGTLEIQNKSTLVLFIIINIILFT